MIRRSGTCTVQTPSRAPVFFTGTAWGGAAYSDRVLPLWGGYAYRPWIFYSHSGEHPAITNSFYTETFGNEVFLTDVMGMLDGDSFEI